MSLAALALGTIAVVSAPDGDYCDTLPTANGGDANLRLVAGRYPYAVCGKYRVTCPDVDDMEYFTLEVPAVGAEHGRVMSMSGTRGRKFHDENVAEYLADGLSVVMIAYEMGPEGAWACAKRDCPVYASADEPGARAAACRPATIAAYHKPADEPYCAQGHSTGTGALSFALAWYGAGDLFKYVQLTAWNPLTRMDYGCDPSRSGKASASYVGTNPSGTVQQVNERRFAYDDSLEFARGMADDVGGLPDNACGAHPTPGVTNEQAARLYENSVAATGANYSYPNTVIDHFACLSGKSVTDGVGSFGWIDNISNANPGRVFMQSQPLGKPWAQKKCKGEDVWWMEDGVTPSPLRQLTIDRMLEMCKP